MITSFNIAIDGPAGAGKSTIAKAIAEKLKFIYVDTGAMYRAMALYFIRKGIDSSSETSVIAACREVNITIEYENGNQQVILNGENVSAKIRTEEVGNMASATSVYPSVRKKLVQLQQRLAESENVIMDGRDIGTCVLPEADLKIFLTASTRTRAQRRFLQLEEKGSFCDLEKIEQDIIDRDNRDINRELSPLRQAEDAVLVDSSLLTADQVVNMIIQEGKKRGLDTFLNQGIS